MTTARKNNRKIEGEGIFTLSLSECTLEEALRRLEALSTLSCQENRIVFLELFGRTEWRLERVTPETLKRSHDIARWFEDLPFITIALVDGELLNNCAEFLFLCDQILATEDSILKIAEEFVPAFGGLQLAVRILGLSKAKKLFILGELPLKEGKNTLVSQIYSTRDALIDGAINMASRITELSQRAQIMTKRILHVSQDLSIEAGLSLEREMFSLAFTTEDKREGIQAFFEKRKPNFARRECHEL